MTILRETMRRYYIGGMTIRVWREISLKSNPPVDGDPDVRQVIQKVANDSFLYIAKSILELPQVNAVEVVDQHGNGDVLYKDWP